MSEKNIIKMFFLEKKSIDIFKKISNKNKNIFAMSHFFQFMLFTYLTKETYNKEIKLLTTFSFVKNKIFSNFINKLNSQCHTSYHNHINISKKKNIIKFLKNLKTSKNIAIFGDVRFKSKNYIEFNLNKLNCYSNNGLFNIIKDNKEFCKYYITMRRCNYRFQIKIREINTIEEYYYLLKNDIKKYPKDWLLWFQSPMFKN